MMKNLFKNFTEFSFSNKIIKSILTILEFFQFLLVIEIIFPINFDYNYYFFLHFLNPIIYIFYTKETGEFISCKNNYNEINTKITEKLKEDIITKLLEKYFGTNINYEEICIFQDIYFYISASLIFFLLGIFLILSINISHKKDEKNNKFIDCIYKKIFWIFCKFLYIILKTFSLTFMIIITNFLIVPIFYYDNFQGLTVILLSSFLMLLIYITISLFFFNYFFNCFNETTYDKVINSTSEKDLFFFKLIVAITINLRFEDYYLEFFEILVIILFFYSFYNQYLIFLKVNVKDISLFFFIFYESVILDRGISLLILLIHEEEKDLIKNNILYFVFQVIIQIGFFLLWLLYLFYKSKTNSNINSSNMNKKLFQILSNLLENILKRSSNLGNQEINISKLKTKVLQNLTMIFTDHKLSCENYSDCFICKKINFCNGIDNNKDINKSTNDKLIEIAKILLKFSDEKLKDNFAKADKNNKNEEEEKEAAVILKVIYLLIIDKEKIHRVSYFLKLNNKKTNEKFKLILENLYEKIIFSSNDEEDKNFVLQKCVELNEVFFSLSKLMNEFVEALSSGKTSIKVIIQKNQIFGDIYNKLIKEMKVFQEKYKFKEPTQYYKYLWCYGILFNKSYEPEFPLETAENMEILDTNFHRDSNFILKFDLQNYSWIIKKIPEIFVNRFGFDYNDLIGKSYEALYPSVLKEHERNRLDKMIMSDREDHKISTVKSFMLDSDGFIRSIEITFEVLPFINENNFIVCNLCKIGDKSEDRVMIFNEKTEIFGMTRYISRIFGISPEIIYIFKDRINLNKLFKIMVDYKLDTFKKIEFNYMEYLNYLVNTYLNESDAFEKNNFLDFYNQIKKLNKPDKYFEMTADFELISTIEMKTKFYIFKLTDLFEKEKYSELKKIEKKAYKSENVHEDNSEEVNTSNINKHSLFADNMSASMVNTGTYNSVSDGSEYFSANRITGIINRDSVISKDNSNKTLSNMLVYLNLILIFLGIIFNIIINASFLDLKGKYDLNENFRSFNSNFFMTYMDFTLLIYPENSQNLTPDGFIKNFKINNPTENIGINNNDIVKSHLMNLTNILFQQQNSIISTIQKLKGDDYYNSLNIKLNLYAMNGNLIENYLFESIKVAVNNIYTITKFKENFYKIRDLRTLKISEMTDIELRINNLLKNFNIYYEELVRLHENLEELLDIELNYTSIKIYIIIFIYLFLHFLLILISYNQVKNFLQRIKLIFNSFNNYTKREFNFLFGKIKCVNELINVVKKPTEAVGFYKIEKKKIAEEISAEKEKIKKKEKSKNYKNRSSEDYDIAASENTALNLSEENSENNSGLVFNFNFEFDLVKKVKKFILLAFLVYISYGILISLIFPFLFSRLDDSKHLDDKLTHIEDSASHYLLNFKVNILVEGQEKLISENYMDENPQEFYKVFKMFINLAFTKESLFSIKEFYGKLYGADFCKIILEANYQLEKTYLKELQKVCNIMDLSGLNYSGIYSFYYKNMKMLYGNYLEYPDKSYEERINFFLNETSQKLSWIYFIYLDPFIKEIRNNLAHKIYFDGINQLTMVVIIIVISIIFIDLLIFFLMKIYVINLITFSQDNLINIANTFMI